MNEPMPPRPMRPATPPPDSTGVPTNPGSTGVPDHSSTGAPDHGSRDVRAGHGARTGRDARTGHDRRTGGPAPELSVVIPVFNEEAVLPLLFERLYPALDALGVAYEIVFINDGSRDRSAALLADAWRARPDVTRVVLFHANFGQHAAIMAGFSYVRGSRIVTLDADLQNPPEEIAPLLDKMREGHDYVGTIRASRNDSWWRNVASRLANRLRERTTRIKMTDQGCMLRAYSRPIVDAIVQSREISTFIPALAYTFAHNPVEITVAFDERAAGTSKYSMAKLLRLNFDLLTAFSTVPLQWFSLLGMATSLGAILFYVALMIKRVLAGDLESGLMALFDRDVLAFILLGMVLFGIGLLGEYIGRIYQQVRDRPRYLVQAVLEGEPRRDDAARPTGGDVA